MIKIDIVKRIANDLQIRDREALAVVDTIIDAIKDCIKEHDRIEIRNFGVFQVKQRKPRTGRNPRNKKEYPINPRKVVTFKLGKELKDFAQAMAAARAEQARSAKPKRVEAETAEFPGLFDEREAKS